MGIPVPRIGSNWTAFQIGQIIQLRTNKHYLKKGTVCQVTEVFDGTLEIVPLYGVGSFEALIVRPSEIRSY